MSIEGSYKKLAAANLRRTERYVKRIEQLLSQATGRFISLSSELPYDKSAGQFYFEDYPEVRKAVEETASRLARGMEQAIVTGTTTEWAQGTKDANGILDYMVQRVGIKSLKDLKPEVVGKYLNNHDAALAAFQKRAIGGMGLSDRVWNLANQSKIEAELARSIADGTSADAIAESMQNLLNDPGNLFRRVRDEFGTLQLSKRARAYTPGAGVYRSSFQNARRLARTEINMAYRNAEQEAYADKDFVVGIEIKRSNNPYDCLVCETLAGKYPKDFKWSGWHPNCRCYMVPLLLTPEEMDASRDAIINGEEFDPTGSANYVGDVPKNFVDWCLNNQERIEEANQWGTLPYFLCDNREYMWAAISDDSQYRRSVEKALSSLSSEYRPKIQELLDRKANRIEIEAVYANIASELRADTIPYSVRFSKQSSVMRSLYEQYDAIPVTDQNARIALSNKIKQKAAILTRWNLRKERAVEGLEYVGFERNHVFHPASTMTTKGGVDVKIERYRKDVVKYKDALGKEYWYPVGTDAKTAFKASDASSVVSEMYPGMQRSFKAIFFDTDRHPLDAFYKLQYEDPLFFGEAYSGEPITFHSQVSVYRFKKTLAHEIGHHIDRVSWTKKWADAIAADGNYVSDYCKKSVREDFAEHFSDAYIKLSWGSNYIDLFAKEFPNRWALLRDVFLQIYR